MELEGGSTANMDESAKWRNNYIDSKQSTELCYLSLIVDGDFVEEANHSHPQASSVASADMP